PLRSSSPPRETVEHIIELVKDYQSQSHAYVTFVVISQMRSWLRSAVPGDCLAFSLRKNPMNAIAQLLGRSGLLKIDYHLLRAAMVIIFAWFGYDKWFESEIRGLLPIITHGPLISWTIPVLGIRGTAILLGTSEWTFGT